MKRVVILACILGAFLFNSVALAQTPAAAVIAVEGKLVNANSGQPVKAGLPLMLHSYDGEQVADLIEGVTEPGGTFRFENVAVTKDRSFEVMATVGQTIYFSPKATRVCRRSDPAGTTHYHLRDHHRSQRPSDRTGAFRYRLP